MICTPKTRFSEPRFSEPRFSESQFSEILDLMNKIQIQFSEKTQFSEQKGSDNHVHYIKVLMYMPWPNQKKKCSMHTHSSLLILINDNFSEILKLL